MDVLLLSAVVLVIFALQAFFDGAFLFVCYLTGMVVLKLLTIFGTDLETLSYGVFKNAYKTEPSYRKPMGIGLIIWLAAIVLTLAL